MFLKNLFSFVFSQKSLNISSKLRIEKRLWNPVAIREAVINAFVHNDYTCEIPPKFEIFDDRIEITSTGGLPEDLSREEFFSGFSVPRNQEIMRVFKDLNLVEHLGSGIPRILESYPEDSFLFSENFLRMTFPNAWMLNEEVTPQDTPKLPPRLSSFCCSLLPSIPELKFRLHLALQINEISLTNTFHQLCLKG